MQRNQRPPTMRLLHRSARARLCYAPAILLLLPPSMYRTHLLEADVVSVLAEASSADVEVVLADQSVRVVAHAAAHTNTKQRSGSGSTSKRNAMQRGPVSRGDTRGWPRGFERRRVGGWMARRPERPQQRQQRPPTASGARRGGRRRIRSDRIGCSSILLACYGSIQHAVRMDASHCIDARDGACIGAMLGAVGQRDIRPSL